MQRRSILVIAGSTVVVALAAIAITVVALGGDDPAAAPQSTTATTAPPTTRPSSTAPPTTSLPTTTSPSSSSQVTDPLTTALPMPMTASFADVGLRAEQALVIPNLTGMVWNDQEDAYFAITQDGTVHRVTRDLSSSEVVLDLTAEVTGLLPGSERGLLGIAFDPRDGRMFLYFTDRGNDTNIVSYKMTDGRPDPSRRRLVLFQEQPGLGHKAGDMAFTPEGNLFVSLGDGGGSSGRDAQDYRKLLGSIIRITPRLYGEGYDVPDDNPFVGQPDIAPELWAKGLRNAWQISLDPVAGDLYLGDVGENDIEELNVIPAGTSGQNFGWYWYEGSVKRSTGDRPPADRVFTPPVFEYPHTVGPAIIAGLVYRGSAIPALRGAYVFADMTGPFFALGGDGTVRLGLRLAGGVNTSFVETPDGEILVTTLRKGIFRILPG